MIIREKFDSSSTGSFESGSNEVFERIVLSEIILASRWKSGSIIGDDIEVIHSRSGFSFDRKTSEGLDIGFDGIVDVENGFFISRFQ